ncbi:hypothetical protein IAQ61_003278 [Plenodomus lingam]|uniref:Uncharacterized protein n=1 Tax=Leptosphaeria maculans (strain JN3 / isolate v23.1.3 / race Av1-4-5-6-7-8) TaxID=985895 RepID=E5AE09_LEPMJ|nr:hypothetical protein LEMA_P002350.1 [Plenodomus lingam JN3]KAH9875813.1 hypothetical protein IAQ61_003278 [Plenodomus lingam]CBY01448.1 hypothetical protein LEMA_P002350.1 [Plenodomus lingam JN3]
MKGFGFLHLSSELRNRIYRLAARDADHGVEKRISRREGTTPVDSDFYRSRGYYGLTQTCRLVRAEFRLQHLKDRAISVHIRDADDYLDSVLTPEAIASENNVGWFSIRADRERRDDYPRKLRPLLLKLYSAANLQFRFTEGQGPSVFNNTFLRYHLEWKYALINDIKHIDAEEASHWGLRIVLNPASQMKWVKDCTRAWFRILHMSEEALAFFAKLGLNPESDMIFIRRGTKVPRDMTSSGKAAKRSLIDRAKSGRGSDAQSIHSKRPLLIPESRSMSFATSLTPSTINQDTHQ